MARRSTQSVGQEPYRSSMTFQLQQPNADPAVADTVPPSPFADQRTSSRRSSAAAVEASQRASMLAAANQQGFNTSPYPPPTPPASLASPVVPVMSTPLAAVHRASATAAAAAASRSRQSGMLNGSEQPQQPLHRSSMLVQLQQPTANGGSIVQPVRNRPAYLH